MDEVGRGTTPEDGTAIGFASLHHLYHFNKSRTLFATHFHALVDMTEDWAGVGRYCTDVLEVHPGSFTFIHKLKPGVNRQSHALKVAKMAGIPQSALDIAEIVQQQLSKGKHRTIDGAVNESSALDMPVASALLADDRFAVYAIGFIDVLGALILLAAAAAAAVNVCGSIGAALKSPVKSIMLKSSDSSKGRLEVQSPK